MVWNMASRLKGLYLHMAWVEKAFVLFLILYLALRVAAPASGLGVLAALATYGLGAAVLIRIARKMMGRVLWRLRNRLIVAYLFIAVVPIVLIMLLAATTMYMVTGQVAVYLISSELGRRTESLQMAAEALSHAPPRDLEESVRRGSSFLSSRFPKVEILARQGKEQVRLPQDATSTHPPAGWKNVNGILVRDRRLYCWAHALSDSGEVTILAPLTRDFLAQLIPELGDVFFINDPNSRGLHTGQIRLPEPGNSRTGHVPPQYIDVDVMVTGVNPLPLSIWESPDQSDSLLLVVHTRTSALLNIVFGPKMDWGQTILYIFAGVSILFLIVEMISFIIGISLTRTIT
ncbi:MAG TPA: hypothetical protein VG672_21680, partial [Bryobacteraceae bacterium]|nr:hypothetical protein [Bryobacteraceae bacterium]